MAREKFKWRTHENESTEAEHRGGPLRSSEEVSVMEMELREWVIQLDSKVNHYVGGICEEGKVV